jgi:potassium-dependent mechanosensitive channel
MHFHTVMAVAATALAVAAPLSARPLPQLPGADSPAAEPAAPPRPEPAPQLFEVAARARLVLDSAAQAERQVERLRDTTGLAADLAEARARQQDLRLLMATVVETEYVRPERISRLRDQAVLEDQRLEALRDRAVERLRQLGELRTAWLVRDRAWRRWRAELGEAEPEYAAVAPDVERVVGRMAELSDSIGRGMADLLALQRRIEDIRVANEEIGTTVSSIRAGRRQALLQRAEPVLLSPAHLRQLREPGARTWQGAAALRVDAYVSFIRSRAGALLMYALLFVIVALVAGRLRRATSADHTWARVIRHPWALGLLAAVAVSMQRVTLAPPLWDVAQWAIFAAAAGVLAGPLLATRALRLTVYLFALFYPAFLLLEVAGLAAPVFRLVIAGIAAVALPVFWIHARRRAAAAAAIDSSDPRRIWPLRIGAAMWAAVLIATVAGYDQFGRWILHATVTSGAVVFMLVLIFTLLRGGIASLLRSETQSRFLQTIALPLAQRLAMLLQALLVLGAVLVVLDIWELTPSPVATWRMIVDAGFSIGSIRITAGRLLAGAAVLYLALTASWLIRAFLRSEAYGRFQFDRGVGESINMLVHYSLIVIGMFAALAVLGVELQNFAIIAGALGIGIGFGLQNVVSNFASGLILLFERPVRVGDTVIVGGEWGTIRKIGLRSTVMETFDQSEMIVPNADLVSEKVVNWTLTSSAARLSLPVGVAYGSDVEVVLRILREAGTAHENVLSDPPPQVLFTGFGDSALEFELRVWIREIRKRFEVRSALFTALERRLREAGVEIPFPQRDLHLRSVDAAAADQLRRGDT